MPASAATAQQGHDTQLAQQLPSTVQQELSSRSALAAEEDDALEPD